MSTKLGAIHPHLRSLLIVGLQGTQMAGQLAGTLESIAFSVSRFYGERLDALAALIPHRDRTWCQSAVETLLDLCTEDSIRLARDLVEKIDCDVPDEVLVITLLSCMGLTRRSLPKRKPTRTISLFHYRRFGLSLPIARLQNVLEIITDFSSVLGRSSERGLSNLAQFISVLVIRSIEGRLHESVSPARLWAWTRPRVLRQH